MKKVNGYILAGGNSRRMGADKGMLQVGGKSMVEHIAETINPFSSEINIITNSRNYDDLGYVIYADVIKNCGPMGGIYTALSYSNTERNLIVSCDMPLLAKEVVQFIVESSTDTQITIPEHGGELEPLCAIYDKSCRDRFEALLKNGEYKLQYALKYFSVKKITMSDNVFGNQWFANINTPEQYLKLKSIYHECAN